MTGPAAALDPGAQAVTASDYRRVLGAFCSGIVVVTALDGDTPVGLTCQSFSSLSLDPPLVVFAPSLTSTSYPRCAVQAGL